MFAPLHIPNMSAVKDVQGDHYRPRYILVQVQIEKKGKKLKVVRRYFIKLKFIFV